MNENNADYMKDSDRSVKCTFCGTNQEKRVVKERGETICSICKRGKLIPAKIDTRTQPDPLTPRRTSR